MASSALDDLIVSNIEKPSRASLNNLYKAISEVQGNAETLAKICKALDCSFDDIMEITQS